MAHSNTHKAKTLKYEYLRSLSGPIANGRPSFKELQNFVDGCVSEERRKEIVGMLLVNPQSAELLQALRDQNERLRALGQAHLSEPVPAHLWRLLEEKWAEREAKNRQIPDDGGNSDNEA